MAMIPQVRITELTSKQQVELYNKLSDGGLVVRFESSKAAVRRIGAALVKNFPGTTFMDEGRIAVLPRGTEFDHERICFEHGVVTTSGVTTEDEPKMTTTITEESTPKAPKKDAGRGRNFDPAAKIKVLVDKNPRRQGSATYDRFNLYRDGMTVEEFLAAGGWNGDLRWDSARKFISVEE